MDKQRRSSGNSLNNWTPLRSMSLMDDFMRLPDIWDDFTSNFGKSLITDMWEDNEAVYIKVSLPGINPDDVEITFSKDTVTIKGEYKEELNEDISQKNYYSRQIKTGNFMQTYSVPGNVDPDKAEASFDKGMLTIKLPKSEETKPKQIKINK